MPSRINNPSAGEIEIGVFAIGEGGHGKQLAREGLLALGGLPASDIALPDNCIPLDADGMISRNYFGDLQVIETGLDGPVNVARGSLRVFTLTTYDSFMEYEVSAERGSVELIGKSLYYRAPMATGDDVIHVDTRSYTVHVTNVEIVKPVILTPSGDFEGNFSTFNFTASTAVILNNAGDEIHASTDWEVATVPDFSILHRFAYQSSDLTTWSAGGFQEGRDYYVRVRYNGRYGSSPWSVPRHLKDTTPIQIRTPVITSPTDQAFVSIGEFEVQATPFTVDGYTDDHVSTDWLIATTANFSTPVVELNASTEHLTTLTSDALSTMVLYYVKCRYRGASRISDWSLPVSFVLDIVNP